MEKDEIKQIIQKLDCPLEDIINFTKQVMAEKVINNLKQLNKDSYTLEDDIWPAFNAMTFSPFEDLISRLYMEYYDYHLEEFITESFYEDVTCIIYDELNKS